MTAGTVLGVGPSMVQASPPSAHHKVRSHAEPSQIRASARTQPPTGKVALTWMPEYMSSDHHYQQSQAVQLASRFDLIVSMPAAFQNFTEGMREANPNLTMLAYANAALLKKSETVGFPEDAFAHDAKGNRIDAPTWDAYLMESSSDYWKTQAMGMCADRASRTAWDGCLVDMLGLGVFSKDSVNAMPVNPSTGQPYTEAEYRGRMAALGQQYSQQQPGLTHIFNSVQNSYRYWDAKVDTRALVSSLPGAQMEDFLRSASDPASKFPTAENWRRNVEIISDLDSRGQTGLFSTKVWASSSQAQVAQWQKFSMASFLMAANGHSYFAFTRSRDLNGAAGFNLPYAMPPGIGSPEGTMTQTGAGVWTRTFENGMSVVNPTTATVTLPLPAPLTTLDGNVVTSLTLAPSTGEVLTGDPTPAPAPAPAPALDDTRPTTRLTSVSSTGKQLRLTGSASDDVAVGTVAVAVRNRTTGLWLHDDGGWGLYQELPAKAGVAGRSATDWSFLVSLPPGDYGFSLIVRDTSRNKNPTPRPWTKVTVGS